jgi:hypothetical protein
VKSKLLLLSALSGILLAASVLTRAQVSFLLPPSYSGNGHLFVGDFNEDGKVDLLTSDGTVNLGRGDGTFSAGSSVTVSSGQLVLALADFNGDGRPDVLEQGTNTLLVLLGNGDGTFRTNAITTPIGVTLTLVAAANLNGDRKADLVGVSSSSLLVYISNGDGTFAPASSYNLGSASASALTTWDFNGDNITDVSVCAAAQEIVLLGNGDGTFKAPLASVAPYSNYYATVGDFNGDGRSDLAISGCDATQNCYICTLLGNGDGTFQAPTAALSAFGPLAAADFNVDGNLDLVAYILQIFLGNGDGTFSTNSRGYSPNVFAVESSTIAVADFNGDGKPDVAGWNTVLLNSGNGTFQGNPMSVGDLMVAPDKFNAVIGDFDHNGTEDIAVSSLGLSVLSNDGTGALSVTKSYPLREQDFKTAVMGDVNRDGNLDLMALGGIEDPGGSIWYWNYSVLLGKGDGTFQDPVVYQQSGATGPPMHYSVGSADFNSDGSPDIIMQSAEIQALNLLLGNGDGTFVTPISLWPQPGILLVSADFNGDGKVDLALSDFISNGTAILYGNGDGTFQTPVLAPSLQGLRPYLAVDLNNDAKVDLVSATYSASGTFAQVALGNGDGTFTVLAPLSNEIVAVGDLNGDGRPDAVSLVTQAVQDPNHIFGYTLFRPSVMLGNGDGTFASPIDVATGATDFYPEILIADMNGDARPDLLMVSQAGLAVILNTTPPGFELYATTLSSTPMTAGDSATSTVKVIPNFGFNKTVTLSCAGLPTGANCAFNPPSIANSSGSSALTIATSPSTAPGTYLIQVRGTAGSVVNSAALSLVVQAAPDFAITSASGSFISETVNAGKAAKFDLVVTPTGTFGGMVNLSCTISPAVTPAPMCAMSVTSLKMTSAAAQPVTVNVSTTAPVTASAASPVVFPPGTIPMLYMVMMLGSACLWVRSRKCRPMLVAPLTMLVLVFWIGCGRGGSSSSHTTPGTPPGTYTSTITASSGGLSHSMTLTVIVQ